MMLKLVCQFYFFFILSYDIIVGLNFPGRRILLSKLMLASRSPRRCELLQRIGIPFETDAPDVNEECTLPAPEAVAALSRRKAAACAAAHPCRFILAADTLVSFNGVSLGKPADEEDAARLLRMLSGQTHQVFTGVTVISPDGREFTETDCTDVTFSPLSEKEIRSYILSGEPMDKAGAYALQGMAAMWIEHLNGSDTSVIGLPLYIVRRLLALAGFPLLSQPD